MGAYASRATPSSPCTPTTASSGYGLRSMAVDVDPISGEPGSRDFERRATQSAREYWSNEGASVVAQIRRD